MERLSKAIQLSTTGDLQRAAMFLERAREVRLVVAHSEQPLVPIKAVRGRKSR